MIDFIKSGERHNSRVNGYILQIKNLFKECNKELVHISRLIPADPDTVFRFSTNQLANNRARASISALISSIIELLRDSSIKEQEAANALITAFLDDLPEPLRNYEPFRTYQNVPINDNEAKIREYCEQWLRIVELGVDSGRRSDKPDSTIVNQLNLALTRPAPLLRRTEQTIDTTNLTVATGALVMGNQSGLLFGGVGHYKSSFRNIYRIALTELDSLYRLQLQERIRNINVIVGYRTVAVKDLRTCWVCRDLDGALLPPSFVWQFWHIQCRCNLEIIRMSDAEIQESARRIEAGLEPLRADQSVNYVAEPSEQVYEFINSNLDLLRRQYQRGKLYSWITLNQNYLPDSLFLPQ